MDACKYCKALHYRGSKPVCELGYEIDSAIVAHPLPCPKPLTYLQLIECQQEQILEGTEKKDQ